MVTLRPEIEYNKEKCGDPSECLACVKSCPYCVLAYRPLETPEPPNPPADWIIVSTCRVTCFFPTCKLCIEACPNQALNIFIPSW